MALFTDVSIISQKVALSLLLSLSSCNEIVKQTRDKVQYFILNICECYPIAHAIVANYISLYFV